MDKGYTGRQFVGLFTPGLADQQVENIFSREFGSLSGLSRGGQSCVSNYKTCVHIYYYVILILNLS
jgi:hypothetical protein